MLAQSDVARELAAELREHEGKPDVYVVAIVPGSLWLAADVAQRLRVPFDLFPVRALYDTEQQGPAIGLVGSGGVLIVDRAAVSMRGCSLSALAEEAQRSARELDAFERELRDGRDGPDLRACTVILLDDGRTPVQILRMAITALRRTWVKSTIVAVPTITTSELKLFTTEADAIVCAVVPDGSATVEAPNLPAPASVAEIRQILLGTSLPEAGQVQSRAEPRLMPWPDEAQAERPLAESVAAASARRER